MEEQLHQALLNKMRKVYPKKSVMVNVLADILRIEKGAVYRRLRREVPFTFVELSIISGYMKISLDSIIGAELQRSIPFELRLPEFISPQEEDYKMFDRHIKFLRSMNQTEDSESASINNLLPQALYSQFHYLSLFFIFKWNFHYNNEKVKSFHQIQTSPEMERFLREYALEMKNFNKTYYVFDRRVFRFIVDNINYFHNIRLIEKDDILRIKEDLFFMLDYLEKMAITGQFRETDKSVNLYISDIDITTNYIYMESKNVHFSLVKMFILSSVASFDKDTFFKVKKWIHSLIKTSTLITLTNERQRILYFEKQRNIINEL